MEALAVGVHSVAYTSIMFWWRKRRSRMAPEFIVFGLGNPGVGYVNTRHNVGWWVLDEIVRQAGADSTGSRHRGQVDYCKLDGISTALVKPTTLMNRSGQCVGAWVREYPETRFVVIHDDISMTPGKTRLRHKGSAGGHRGVESIISALRSEEFDRLKIGVGAPPLDVDAASYVLEPPVLADEDLIAAAIQRAAQALTALAGDEYDLAVQILARSDGT